MRKQLDFWMSQGISDPLARATTITLYTDVDQFNESLGFEDNTTISIALVSPSGKVHWKGKDEVDSTKCSSVN